MLKIGIAGIGFMGWIHWLAYQELADAQVVAVCDQDPKRLQGDWTGIQGNFGPPGQQIDLSGVATFDDLKAFCQSDFDMIDICLPPALHASTIALAAKHGKHVFCEKPLALTIAECDSAVEACRQGNRLFMVGQVLPYFPEYQFALQAIQSKKYGILKSAHFKRIISDPTWLKDFYDPQKIGGPLFDLHVHDAHFVRLVAGMPSGVYSAGQLHNGVVKFCQSIFEFDDQDICISATSGVIDQQGRPFTHGFEIQLDRATIQFEYAALESGDQLMPLKVIDDDGKVSLVTIENADPVQAFISEIRDVVAAVNTGTASPILAGELARDAIRICQAESDSVKNKRPIRVN